MNYFKLSNSDENADAWKLNFEGTTSKAQNIKFKEFNKKIILLISLKFGGTSSNRINESITLLNLRIRGT